MDEYTALRWESSWKKVVSMIGQILLTERKAQLIEVITKGWKSCRPHTAAFLLRILPAHIKRDLETSGLLGVSSELESTYGGYPDVAFLGYSLASEPSDSKLASLFLEGCERLRKRDTYSTRPFFLDDLAVLGVADGLAILPQETQMKSWLLEGIERNSHQSLWSSRMRHLASDLLAHHLEHTVLAQRLTRHVERQIVRVHHTTHKAHPVGHEVLGVLLDQNLATEH